MDGPILSTPSQMPAIVGFKYDSVGDAALASEMQIAASRIRDRMKAALIDVGRDLIAIKDRVEHGKFVEWVENECLINIRTAQRMMAAVELITTNDKLSYLPRTTLELLAVSATPRPTVEAIKEPENFQDSVREVLRLEADISALED